MFHHGWPEVTRLRFASAGHASSVFAAALLRRCGAASAGSPPGGRATPGLAL